jgi:mannose-6-phosphate isomerase-like protein (cupin superfamily)
VLARLRRSQNRPLLDWRKSWAAVSPAYYAAARNDRVLDVVELLLGEDVVLWGASLIRRRPGDVHVWHTDIESSAPSAETVTVWVGLANTDQRSSLKVVRGSHRFGVTLQEARHRRGRGREDVLDTEVASWAREIDDQSAVVQLDTGDGEAMFFDGRIWHGSENVRRVGTRYALLLQYATPRTAIRMPGPQRFEWPFDLDRAPRAPCILVSGRDDGGVNRIVPPPVGGGQDSTALSSRVHGLDLPLERDVETGWKPHGLFRGSTADIGDLRCHVSVLEPGRSPHAPHRHDAEELLVIIDGQAELLVEDGGDPSGIRRHVVGSGTFAYYPVGFAHTIENTSAEPVTYCMLKWKGDARDVATPLEARVVPLEPAADPTTGERAITDVLDGETTYLRHLHAHATTLPPGVGYEPHRDSYDVGIVTLAGRVETLGDQVDAPGVVFYAAGEPHGMRNVGDEPAHYLVFELHGRHSTSGRIDDRSVGERARRLIREPHRLKYVLGAGARALRGAVRRR